MNPLPLSRPQDGFSFEDHPLHRKPLPKLPSESPETLDQVTKDLCSKVDNWHGLDFTR